MPIKTLAVLPENPRGVMFWWSNILRGYQLRVYLDSGPLEPEFRLTRPEAESAACSLAVMHQLEIYEIDIPRIENGPLD